MTGYCWVGNQAKARQLRDECASLSTILLTDMFIDEEVLNHLRSADDVFISSNILNKIGKCMSEKWLRTCSTSGLCCFLQLKWWPVGHLGSDVEKKHDVPMYTIVHCLFAKYK